MRFEVNKEFTPRGDQQKVIKSVSQGLREGEKYQTIVGATGTGKTYVLAKIVEAVQRPSLVISHNKTLAAQLYRELKHFFPDNAVSYFVSYYDYYQPEAYVAKKDLYIEKDSSINDEIDRMRLNATASLIERKDVIIVASVSCIYGLGSPDDYKNMHINLTVGDRVNRSELIKRLVDIQYERNDDAPVAGKFRVRGDIIDILPAYRETGYRVELFGDEVEGLSEIDVLNNRVTDRKENLTVFPAKHFVMPFERVQEAVSRVESELEERCDQLEKEGKQLEKERLWSRTRYDMELLTTLGYCSGVENYSRHLSGRAKGESPATLLDYFPDDFLTFIDESHVTVSQISGMYNGDQSRKQSLVDYGFRLPSALDNRPLYLEEFINKAGPLIFVSATPGDWELERSTNSPDLVNRPTGLIDPVIDVRGTEGQIDDLLSEIRTVVESGFRVLVTTLTKKMSEDLTAYLKEHQVKVNYLHSDIETIERVEILKSLRLGEIDVLVGINLLREGLDLPEVALVTILDADKIGFLRSKRSLIQTVGRASRNVHGRVIMYADKMTDAMEQCIDETNRRREIQLAYNKKHGIVPTTIIKPVEDILVRTEERDVSIEEEVAAEVAPVMKVKTKKEAVRLVKKLDLEMKLAADNMEFEKAIILRDQIAMVKAKLKL